MPHGRLMVMDERQEDSREANRYSMFAELKQRSEEDRFASRNRQGAQDSEYPTEEAVSRVQLEY